ncbi:MAG: hypothetical protein WAO58_08685 [Fimbriimonadaceae bacterium]
MKHQRGSAYIYVLLMVASITVIALAIADSSLSFSQAQARAEQRSQADYLLDGGAQHVEVARVYSRIPLPSSNTATIDGNVVTLDFRATPDPKQMQVTAKATVANREYKRAFYTGRSRPTPFYFGMASRSPVSNPSKKLILGSSTAPASLYAYGPVSSSGNNGNVYGDIEAVGAIVTDMTVSGAKYPNLTADIFTTTGLLDYLTLSSTKYLLSQTWDGYTFNTVGPGAPYHLVHITGSLTLRGVISGKGTIYVTGSVTINNDVTYADADSKLVIIANGNINVNDDAVGYYYTASNTNIKDKVLTGGLYALGTLTWDNNAVVYFDPYIAINPEEGSRFRLPGY